MTDHRPESVGRREVPSCPKCAAAIDRRLTKMLAGVPAGELVRGATLRAQLLGPVTEDLHALATHDPAAGNSCTYVLGSYACFQAVMAYRLSHALLARSAEAAPAAAHQLRLSARVLSEHAKIETSVEIHPAAEIGRRFVVDHGNCTVIGETARIGDDCYILQGVILGSRGIATNPSGSRHPTLGNRVEVGAFARLLGPIVIGDDVLVGPHCVVCCDIP